MAIVREIEQTIINSIRSVLKEPDLEIDAKEPLDFVLNDSQFAEWYPQFSRLLGIVQIVPIDSRLLIAHIARHYSIYLVTELYWRVEDHNTVSVMYHAE